MQLQHIELDNLKTTTLNVRKKGAKNIHDLVPSIRSLGILQPLLVRSNDEGFEIVAGQRRFYALQELAKEQTVAPVPCIVMKEGDDAKVIEASLAENIARLPMDEIDQYKAFAALVKQGNSVEEIAAQFGISERMVKQRLAIANLISPILTAYRKDDTTQFWALQNQAIAKAKEHSLAEGWTDVVVLDIGEYFPSYDYVDTAKEDGGKVYVTASTDGEVTFYEGQLPRKEAKARLKAENGEETVPKTKPELTQTMQNYLDLHRKRPANHI